MNILTSVVKSLYNVHTIEIKPFEVVSVDFFEVFTVLLANNVALAISILPDT